MQEEKDLNLNDLTSGNSSDDSNHPEVIEVEWEDAKVVVAYREELQITQSQFSRFLLQMEKQKASFLSRCELLEKEMYKTAESLQEKYDVSNEVTYELKLPTQEEEKGYFIRKEE